MKRNQKLYVVADNVTPVEVQEFNDRKVEIFLMDDFEGIKEEFVLKRNEFAVWTSVDGKNYRLFIENGYYDAVKDLYGEPVNKIWIEFWDKTDVISGKFQKMFIYPLMIVAVAIAVITLAFQSKLPTFFPYIIIGVLVALFLSLIFVNMYVKKQIVKESNKSREEIVKHFGENRFDQLIEIQKTYMDDFYDKYYAEKAEFKAKEEAEALENKEEQAEAIAEDAKEEAPAEEAKAEEATEALVVETEVTEEIKKEIEHEEAKEIKALEEEKKEEALEDVADSIQESNIVE